MCLLGHDVQAKPFGLDHLGSHWGHFFNAYLQRLNTYRCTANWPENERGTLSDTVNEGALADQRGTDEDNGDRFYTDGLFSDD